MGSIQPSQNVVERILLSGLISGSHRAVGDHALGLERVTSWNHSLSTCIASNTWVSTLLVDMQTYAVYPLHATLRHYPAASWHSTQRGHLHSMLNHMTLRWVCEDCEGGLVNGSLQLVAGRTSINKKGSDGLL